MLGWIGNDQSMKMSESSRGQDKKLAVNNNPNLFSMVEHHLACITPVKGGVNKGKTLHPIYGNEIYHIDTYANKEKLKSDERYHLVLLAKNQKGLENLFAITTEAGIHKVKGKTKDFQLVEEQFLDTHGEGIICLSACLGGKIAKLIVAGKYDEAKKLAWHFNGIFEEFYLEIQPHDMLPEQVLVNNALLQMHKETGIPLVITSDSHYVRKEDKEYHDILKEIDHMKGFVTNSYMWTPDELIDWCNKNGVPLEAIENTAKIADSCVADITPTDPKGLMPSFPCPPGYTEDSYLIKLTNEGMLHRFKVNKKIKDIRPYISRMNYELSIITQMGFSGYFLILWDWFKWCKQNDVLLGPGRGSAAGSVVAYFLDITKIDPIENGLIFERFLNPQRIEEPDEQLIA